MTSSLTNLSGVGPKTELYLKQNGITSIVELANHEQAQHILGGATGIGYARAGNIIKEARNLLHQEGHDHSEPTTEQTLPHHPAAQADTTDIDSVIVQVRYDAEAQSIRFLSDTAATIVENLTDYYARHDGDNTLLIQACLECKDSNERVRIGDIKQWLATFQENRKQRLKNRQKAETDKATPRSASNSNAKGQSYSSSEDRAIALGFLATIVCAVIAASASNDYLPWMSIAYGIAFAFVCAVIYTLLTKWLDSEYLEGLAFALILLAAPTFLATFTAYQYAGLGKSWHDTPWETVSSPIYIEDLYYETKLTLSPVKRQPEELQQEFADEILGKI